MTELSLDNWNNEWLWTIPKLVCFGMAHFYSNG